MTDFSGTWRNQVGSVLELEVTGRKVSGRFESEVGADGKTLWVELVGQTIGDLITFNAVYERYRTIVTWVGQRVREGETDAIQTFWIHASEVPDDPDHRWMWLSKKIGADTFRRL